MAGVSDNRGDLDSAGVYFMTVEEFESRSETKMIRERQSDGKCDSSGGEPTNSCEEEDHDPNGRRAENETDSVDRDEGSSRRRLTACG